MTLRPSSSATLTQCWYSRIHLPGPHKKRTPHGILLSTCRYCRRALRSEGGKNWTLADGFDLDALGERASQAFICVTDAVNGVVIARYPIDNLAPGEVPADRLVQIRSRYERDFPDEPFEFRIMGGSRPQTDNSMPYFSP